MKLSIKILSLFLIIGTTAYAADTASILPPAKTTFFDQNGKPLTSGKVDFYIPSTTTRKTTWQDASETIPNLNPVILDAAGRALILGSGSYRQVVKDRNDNIIWDQVTSSAGSGGGSGPTATGDGDLVGTIKPWAGMTAPNQYMFTYGEELSRTTFSALFTAITSSQAVFCNSGSAIVSGLTDTTNFNVGVPVELSCVAGGVTSITAKTSTTVTLALTPNVTANVTATFFPWGNGNSSTTFNLPDYRGIIPIGNNNMGGVASSNMTSTYFGTNPNSTGATGGSQSTVLLTGNLPAYTPSGTIINGGITSTVSGGTKGAISTTTAVSAAGHAFADVGPDIVVTSTQLTSGFVGNAQGGTSIAFSRVQPSQTVNFIIKVTPDANSATASGVTSLGGMTGSIACGAGLLCTGNVISSSIANPVSGPTTSAIGNVTFWTDTLGKSIGATPAFLAANPGNAAIYSQLASPSVINALFNGFQFGVGSVIPGTEQFGGTTVAVQQGLVGTVVVSTGTGTLNQNNGSAGYCRADRNLGACVGIFGQSGTSIANTSLFGFNGIVQNINAPSTTGFDVNYFAGGEVNPNLWQKAGSTNATVTQNHFYGINIQGGGNHTDEIGSAITINNSAFPAITRWGIGVEFVDGCCIQALTVGAATLGVSNQPSMLLTYKSVDAGSVSRSASTFSDANGSYYMIPALNANILGEDGAGNVLFISGTSLGGSKFGLPLLTTAGVTTNTASGLIGTLAGTSTTLLHGNASGLPTFSAVSLTADVSGSLPATNGGTGQTAYVLGDTLYSPSANTLFRLPGNTTAVKQYLSQTGTGAVSAAPVWASIAGADITGAALTKTDDTNVTLTLGGTPTTALLRAASLTLGWTGTLAVSRGGTGLASGTSGGIPYFNGTTSIASSALLTANAIVTGGGAGAAPSTLASLGTTTTVLHGNAAGAPTFGAIALTTDVSGILPIANGGTGNSSGTATVNANLTGDVTSVGNATIFTGKSNGSLGQIPGETTTGSATSGNLGEYIESAIASPGGSLTNLTAANVTSISLTGGDWDVSLNGAFLTGATTNLTQTIVGLSTTSATLDLSPGKFSVQNFAPTVFGAVNQTNVLQNYRISLASTTTVYFVARASFSVSTVTVWGLIRARRAR